MKTNSEKKSERLELRLVALGYSQAERVDNQETFAPLQFEAFMLVILTLAATNDWRVDTMEVRSGNLKPKRYEEIDMKIPPDTDISDTRW